MGIDAVVASARAAGLSGALNVTPPAEAGNTYMVKETRAPGPSVMTR
ncbi:hypothetical protein [Streptomyces sp. RKAG290]|nr:hypothetical protein [Streptomyces sp. RKAG290]MCM2416408.1 hypothetical protein [Streptomyces sp. RKAG290]